MQFNISGSFIVKRLGININLAYSQIRDVQIISNRANGVLKA